MLIEYCTAAKHIKWNPYNLYFCPTDRIIPQFILGGITTPFLLGREGGGGGVRERRSVVFLKKLRVRYIVSFEGNYLLLGQLKIINQLNYFI